MKAFMSADGQRNIDHDPLIDSEWEASTPLASSIASEGIQGRINANKQHAERVISGTTDTITCMDGRTDKEGKVACAGCGLVLLADNNVNLRSLNPSREALAMLPKPVSDFIHGLIERGIKNVESHQSCGAGGYYADYYRKSHAGAMNGEEAAILWGKKLAEILGGKHEHVGVEPHFHNERAAYYSFSDSFNPKLASDIFPPGYVITRSRFKGNEPHAASEMALAAKISFEHGFGDRFTKETPFLFIVVARTDEEERLGKEELSATVTSSNGRIKMHVARV